MAISKFSEEQKAQYINEVLTEWVEIADEALAMAIKKKGKRIPTGTQEKIRFQVLQQSAGYVGKVLLAFNDSARHVDMKNIEWGKAPIQEGDHFIYEWVKKNSRRFKKGVPGYTNNAPRLTEDQKLMRIANAIVQAKRQSRTRKRRGKWFSKTFYGQVNDMVILLVKKQHQWWEDNIAQQIEDVFNA